MGGAGASLRTSVIAFSVVQPKLPPAFNRFIPPRLKEGVAAERNLSQLYCLPYTFPPTMTSTVARSNGFHAASPIHARVSPR
jgi:hypothetical protein